MKITIVCHDYKDRIKGDYECLGAYIIDVPGNITKELLASLIRQVEAECGITSGQPSQMPGSALKRCADGEFPRT